MHNTTDELIGAESGDMPGAIHYFTEAIKLKPDDFSFYTNRCAAYLQVQVRSMSFCQRACASCAYCFHVVDPTAGTSAVSTGNQLLSTRSCVRFGLAFFLVVFLSFLSLFIV
jgi:hypothetical protein